MSISNSVFNFTSFYNPSALEQNESPFRKSPLTEEEAFAKMVKNSRKALLEHKAIEAPLLNRQSSVYASLEDLSFLGSSEPFAPPPLQFTTFTASAQGSRGTMEDVSFISSIPNGIVTGVLDGHHGDKVATFASAKFKEIFPNVLEQTQGHVHRALEVTSGIIQKEILLDSSMNGMGSTAVFSVFDPIKHQVITTTIGDSEANIYRKKEGQVFSIPLSCVRDWTSKKDEARARTAHNDPRYFSCFNRFNQKVAGWNFVPKSSKDRYLTSNDKLYETNVSRAFGKAAYAGSCTHKGKTTISGLKKDDIVVIASDGLKDHKEADIVNIVAQSSLENLSQALVNYAIAKPGSDNVSVVVIHASEIL